MLAARLYDLLPENGSPVSKERLISLAEQVGIPAVVLPRLCWVMVQFDLVRVAAAREPSLLVT